MSENKIICLCCKFSQRRDSNTYDLVGDQKVSDIPFVRVELPNKEFLKKQRAEFVLLSFKNNKKVLFTGLIPLGENYYYGDNVKLTGKKDFLIVYYNPKRKILHLYTIKNHKPKKKADFANEFIEYLGSVGKLLTV